VIERFIQERKYLGNVSVKTLMWYKDSFRAFEGAFETEEQIKQRIVEIRQRGVRAVSVNTYLRCIRAYWEWQGKQWTIPRLKEEQKILTVFNAEQIARIVKCKPEGQNEVRVWTMAMTAMDSGLRIQELIYLTRADVDFENLVMKVRGKGNKQRLVPMSIELRKHLFRFLSRHRHSSVFATKTGVPIMVRNAQRDFKVLCERLGIAGVRTSFHTLRHTFAVNYLKAGGNLYYLQRILGHSSITTTEKYLRSLGIEDLKKVHDGLSLLSR
jgi:site-specific recombinase XerD